MQDLLAIARDEIRAIRDCFEKAKVKDSNDRVYALNPILPWSHYYIYNEAIDRCNTVLSLLNDVYIELILNLIFNGGFEALEDEYHSVFKEETSQTTDALNEELLTGVRYYWDVRAYNITGWGPSGHEYIGGEKEYFRSFVAE